MSLFKTAQNQMCFAKVGIFGFAGSGKTRTATDMAIGIAKTYCGDSPKPIYFIDTETGSDFMIPRVKDAGLELRVLKSRAFTMLCRAIPEAEKEGSVLIVDSLTHFWRELCDAYQKQLNRKRLQFQDWQVIKADWGTYTDLFLNSQLHIITCGRAGYEYDFDINEDGTKDLVKTGTKMKAETEFGFEPSLVVEMEARKATRDELDRIKREVTNKFKRADAKAGIYQGPGGDIINRAHVLKDRWDLLMGQAFDFPTFDNFRPHFDMLNIGGVHVGVDLGQNSQGLFEGAGSDYKSKKNRREYAADTVQQAISKPWPGSTKEERGYKNGMFEHVFNELSMKVLDTMPLEELEAKCDALKVWSRRIMTRLEGAENPLQTAIYCYDEVASEGKRPLDDKLPEGF